MMTKGLLLAMTLGAGCASSMPAPELVRPPEPVAAVTYRDSCMLEARSFCARTGCRVGRDAWRACLKHCSKGGSCRDARVVVVPSSW